MKEKITEKIKEFIKIVESSDSIAGFTGAGISTESGIPDYRSKGGIWDKFKPVFIDEFLSSEEKRNIYWERKIELWNSMINSKPGKTHLFFKELYDRKKLKGLITQNIDGLHEKSGLNTPAASFPIMAKRNGALLVIITISKTPLDDYADMVFHIKLGEFWNIYDKNYE